MPQTCKRRPARGGVAVHSLGGDGLHSTGFDLQHPDSDLPTSTLATRWLQRRYRLSAAMAAAVACASGLGGVAR